MEDKILKALKESGEPMDHHEIKIAIQSEEIVVPVLMRMAEKGQIDLVPSELPEVTKYKIR